MILGAGVGWNDAEYEAVGVHKSERGKRTDEMLDIMMPLLEGKTVTYHGRFYSVDDVFIEPRRRSGRRSGSAAGRSWPIPSRPTCRGSSSRSRRGSARRRLDPASDLPAGGHRPRLGRAAGATTASTAATRASASVAHENFLHLVLTNDPAKAREEQHRAFLNVMSSERGPEYLETVYLFGTPDEVVASLQARVDAGVEYFVLHTMTPDPAQLQRWVDQIIPNVKFPATRRPGARPPAAAGDDARVALLGKPLRRRHSQVMHDAAFEAAGIDARYVLLRARARTRWGPRSRRRAGPTGSGSG